MIRAVTIAREYGSGGGEIASVVARRLGWDLIDKQLLRETAEQFHLRDSAARRLQERGSWWLERVARAVWLETGGTTVDMVDAESVHEFTCEAIREAYERSQCVIVGRGGQCVLRGCPDVLHVFVFAPIDYRMTRLRSRYRDEELLKSALARVDEERAAYIREFHDTDWKDTALYDLWVNGKHGVSAGADVICASILQADTH